MMTSPVLLLLAPLVGVTFGYKPSADSKVGYDYTVQVEPEMVEQMQRGNADSIEFDIPPEVTPIRRIKVVVGTQKLEKTLRPAAARTTYKQDLDTATSGLLAQTGPAGGYGRSAQGFNSRSTTTPRPTTTSAPAPIVVPSIGTTTTQPSLPPNVQNSLNASFQAAGTGMNNTANAATTGVNNVNAAAQNTMNSAQSSMNGMMTAPNLSTVNSTSAPLNNAAIQQEFQNTTNAMRDSINRATGSTSSIGANERSVLAQPNATSTNTSSSMSQAEKDYWDSKRREQLLREQQLRDQQRRDEQARLAAESAAARSSVTSSGFPERPRLESVPDRSQLNVIQPFGDRTHLAEVTKTKLTDNQGPALTADFAANASNNAGNSTPTLPQLSITSDQGTAKVGITNASKPNVDNWSPPTKQGAQQAGFEVAVETPKEPGLPGGVFAWAIALGLGFVNLFQWLNLVDMRNKYRVALRRSSPNFARSMAA